MKRLIFLLLVFKCICLEAQTVWAPIGAEWHYDKEEMLPFPNHGYISYKVIKDTIVSSHTAKLVYKQVVYYNGVLAGYDSLYTYEENSKVYFLINNIFQMVYDFSADVGDTIKLTPDVFVCDSVSPIIVDSINTNSINGISLKTQFVSYKDLSKKSYNHVFTDKFIEVIGHERDLVFRPTCRTDDNFIVPFLRCYQDSSFFYKNSYWVTQYPNNSCDALIDDITSVFSEGELKIYPNPTKGLIYFDSKSPINKLEIYDLNGSKIKDFSKSNILEADLSELPRGIYLLKIWYKNYDTCHFKILKN